MPPRPLDPPPGASPERPWIVSMGRLVPDKGFDVLLAAFAAIAARFPRWQLLIVGDGVLLRDLRRQARDLDDQVVFTGAIATPFSLLRRAQLFVMASRYEGFPMAHAEALACGVPVIAIDCPSRPRRGWERREPAGGVRELVLHNVNGVLVRREDPVALAQAMSELMEDPARRESFARQAVHVVARFSAERVMDQWQQLLRQAVP